MLKIFAVLAVLCGVCAGYSLPAQNAYMYYQRPMGYRTVQRAMYGMHFRNQQFRNQRVSDLPSGVHLNDCQHLDANNAEPSIQDSNAVLAADAYPSEQFPVEDEPQQDVPAIYEDEPEETISDEPFAAPVVPAVVPVSIPEKKKVPVQIDSNEEEEEQVALVGRRREGDSGAPNAFFPINFGSASGGSIAIANSYSTGQGGSSTSTATAYGSPASNELRRTSVSQLKKRPAKFRGRQ